MHRFTCMRLMPAVLAALLLVPAAMAQTQDDAVRQENQRRIDDQLRQMQRDTERRIQDDARSRTDNDNQRLDTQQRILEEMKRAVPKK